MTEAIKTVIILIVAIAVVAFVAVFAVMIIGGKSPIGSLGWARDLISTAGKG